jgi:hypothetical protein
VPRILADIIEDARRAVCGRPGYLGTACFDLVKHLVDEG